MLLFAFAMRPITACFVKGTDVAKQKFNDLLAKAEIPKRKGCEHMREQRQRSSLDRFDLRMHKSSLITEKRIRQRGWVSGQFCLACFCVSLTPAFVK